VEKVSIWTPDKDLPQCVRGDRVVQVDRKGQSILDAEGVRAKFGVDPVLIPDCLALVVDPGDGYPGILGIGSITAARLPFDFALESSMIGVASSACAGPAARPAWAIMEGWNSAGSRRGGARASMTARL